ncbi:hypothetical protein LAUMK13_03252 [Mycobacterium innocens]|uniref:Uncharacterized protein n=1 Tax=Mycobacterium innocens TaxID=2341083 RepID=A0A498Q7H6_9MYCO|nr:hypothetical protein LAUMK13_03252 [Mycobacterium innocens]
MTRESSSASDQASAGCNADAGASAPSGASGASGGASGASAVAATGGAEVNTVALVSAGPRAARNAAPIAAVSCGRGAVTTGTPNRPDSVVVTDAMLAPPPTEMIATRSAG